MKAKAFLFILSIIITLGAFSQEKIKIKKIDFITKEQGADEAWKLIKQGDKNYRQGKAFYREARKYYLRAYNYNDKNAALNYKIGVCYLYADEKTEALKYLKKAFELNNNVSNDIHFQLARAYHMNLDFDNAIKEYQFFKSNTPIKKLKKINYNIDKLIENCQTGKEIIANPERAVVKNVGKGVNSEYDDFGPVIDMKEEIMYFTSRRPSKYNTKRNLIDKKYSEDIYYSRRRGNEWLTAQLLSKKLTSKKNEAALAVSPDNDALFIYRSKKNGNIYISELEDGKWQSPVSVSRINTGRYRETSISLTKDGSKMFFVSDADRKDAIGGKDIYYCTLTENGRWSKPKNIGSPINTFDNEDAVYVTPDGKTLYFSSKGHPGLGGYDIFKSEMDENGIWSKPANLGYPINTPDDDMYFKILSNGKIGFLSSNRENTVGETDIYSVIFLGAEKEYAIMPQSSPLAFELYDKPDMFRIKPQMVEVDTSIIIMGRVLDSETKNGIMAKIQFIDSEKSKLEAVLLSDSTGNYKTKLPTRKNYGVEITSRGYMFYLDVVNLKKETADVINKDFILQPLSVGAKVVLKNIFFETGKATLKPESFQQLNTVISFLKENPTLKLEISGHTDNVGGLSYNLRLSEARAKAVVTYLIENGVEKDRLTYKGYGPNKPVAPNKTADGRALNRRVEFKITAM